MPSTKKPCEYEKCNASFWGGKRAMYCPDKNCGAYQRRLDKAKLDKQKGEGE